MKNIFYIILLSALFSCGLFTNYDDEKDKYDREKYTELSLNLTTASRTILPDFSNGGYSFRISFTGDVAVDPLLTTKQVNTVVLPNGNWRIDVECISTTNEVISSGFKNIVLPDENSVEIPLELSQNLTGSLLLNINYQLPNGLNIGTIDAKLISTVDNSELPLTVVDTVSPIVLDKTGIPSGYHIILVEFTDSNNNRLTPFSEIVHIYDNVKTISNIELFSHDFNSIPKSPQGINATNEAKGVKLTWSDISTNDEGVIVERKTTGNDYTVLATINGYNIDTFTDMTVTDGTEYSYRVKSFNFLGESEYSSEIIVTVLSDPLKLHVSVNGTGDGLSWGAPLGDIQEAIDKAILYDRIPEIWVSVGTYSPQSRPNKSTSIDTKDNHYTLRDGVYLYGGFVGNETDKSSRNPWVYKTVLNGDINNDDALDEDSYGRLTNANNSDNLKNMFYMPDSLNVTNAAIDGFNITGVYAENNQDSAIYSVDNIFNIVSCLFENNISTRSKAVLDTSGGEITIDTSVFSFNGSRYGAIIESRSLIVKTSLFVNNKSDLFNSMGSLIIDSSTLYNNNEIIINGTSYNNDTVINNSILVSSGESSIMSLYSDKATMRVNNSYISSIYSSYNWAGLSFNNLIKSGLVLIDVNDPDGADDIWLTSDDGLQLADGSSGIDSGEVSVLLSDLTDINNNGNYSEKTQFDIVGNDRILNKKIDMGAYESDFTDITACGAATITTVTPLNEALKVEWDYPANNDIYKAVITEENELFPDITIFNRSSEVIIPGLTNGETYNINIELEDFSDNVSAKVSTTATPTEIVIPDVTSVVTLGSNKEIFLTWEKPSDYLFKEYEVSWETPSLGKRIKVIPNSETETLIPNLDNGKTYIVTIKLKDFNNNKSQGVELSIIPSKIVYVDGSIETPGNGLSWEAATDNLGFVMLYAADKTDVWVKQGVYYPQFNPENPEEADNKQFFFTFTNNIKVYGGFDGSETTLEQRDIVNNKTVLSGDYNDDDLVTGAGITLNISNNSENAKYILKVSGDVSDENIGLLDGLTFKGGNSTSNAPIYFSRKMPLINHCIFEENSGSKGGALYFNYVDGRIYNSVFDRNISSNNGGAIYSSDNLYLVNSIVSRNKTQGKGGGIYGTAWYCRIYNSTVIGNYAKVSGGGLYDYNSDFRINNSIFSDNDSPIGNEISLFGDDYRLFRNNCIEGYPESLSLESDADTDHFSNLIYGGVKFHDIENLEGLDGNWFTTDDGLQLLATSSTIDTGYYSYSGNDYLDEDNDGYLYDNPLYDILGNNREMGNEMDLGAYESAHEDTFNPSPVLAPNVNISGLLTEITWTDSLSYDCKEVVIKYVNDNGYEVTNTVSKGQEIFHINGLDSQKIYDFELYAKDYSGNLSEVVTINNTLGGIIIDFSNPEDEDIDLTQSAKILNSSSQLTITINSIYDSYLWYLDGTEIVNDSNTEVIDCSILEVGKHYITCVVEKNGNYYTKNITFEVTNN